MPLNKKVTNAKSWIAKTFGDYNSVLQYEDTENHRIIIKGEGRSPSENQFQLVQLPNKHNLKQPKQYPYTFTMTFDFKEDKYRIKIEDITFIEENLFGTLNPWDEFFNLQFVVADAKDRINTFNKQNAALKGKKIDRRGKTQYQIRKEREDDEQRMKENADAIAILESSLEDGTIEDMVEGNSRVFKLVFGTILNSAAKDINDDF